MAAFVDFIDGRTRQKNAESASVFLVPFLIRHFAAVRAEPENVFDVSAFDGPSLKEIAAAENRMILANGDEFSQESDEFLFTRQLLPVHPAEFIVLAVAVVVSLLGAAEYIAVKQHGDSLGQKQSGEEVSLLAHAQRVYGGI